ncbi:hypothetical protein AT6N2_C0633 [Agrobacterium tumefaciens]|nr:hypothetical protein AT6N2_C0633 [Agrobacterium tumefaciens]
MPPVSSPRRGEVRGSGMRGRARRKPLPLPPHLTLRAIFSPAGRRNKGRGCGSSGFNFRGLPPQFRPCRIDQRPFINQPRFTVLSQQQRPVEIGKGCALSGQHSGRHAERGAEHAADHDGETEPFGLRLHDKRFRQAAGLVELDVDGIVTVAQAGEVLCRMHALVGADQNRMVDAGENRVLAGGKRLFDQRYLQFCCKPQIIFDIVVVPALIRIDYDARLGRGGTNGAQAGLVVGCAGLDLQQRAGGILCRLCRHGVGIGKRDRVGSDERLYRLSDNLLGGALAAHFRFEIPQCAIDGVAGRARFHRLLQVLPCQAASDLLGHNLDVGDDALNAFAITRVGHTFTFTGKGTIPDGARYDIRMRPGAA